MNRRRFILLATVGLIGSTIFMRDSDNLDVNNPYVSQLPKSPEKSIYSNNLETTLTESPLEKTSSQTEYCSNVHINKWARVEYCLDELKRFLH
jgi:hypothetical protein